MSLIKTVVIPQNDLNILCELLRKQIMEKYSSRSNSTFINDLQKAIEETISLSSPIFQFSINDIKHETNNSFQLENSIKFNGTNLGFALNNADRIGIFLITLGQSIVKRIEETGHSDIALSYFLDETASGLTELCADYVHAYFHMTAVRNKMMVTQRYSPGHCGWNIRQQQKIFSMLDPSKIGVKLTPNCLMVPRKSLTAILGIGNKKELANSYLCHICDEKKDCAYKRPPFNIRQLNKLIHILESGELLYDETLLIED